MSRSRPKPQQSHPAASPAEAEHEESGGGPGERLQKVLAAAGIASRRDCEELIVTGRVEVDRRTVTELGTRVDPFDQEIRVDGVVLPQVKRLYYLLNKPVGVVCTNDDPSGRTRVVDLINTDQRLFPVGRLDRTSEGLILVTNDGELANRLTHPRYGVPKTYLAAVLGHPQPSTLDKLRHGVHLAEGFARVESIVMKRRRPRDTELIIVLKEGRNREIRRLLARVGHKVLRLRRIAIGPLKIEDLAPGAYRKLTQDEVKLLQTTSRRPPKGKSADSSGEHLEGSERPRTGARPARPARPSRGARPVHGARPARGTQPARGARPARGERPIQGARPARGNRPLRPTRAPVKGSRSFEKPVGTKPLIDKRSSKSQSGFTPPAQGKVLGFDDSDGFDE